MNLQLRFNLLPIIKQRLDLFVDVLNVFALRTTTGVTENDGPSLRPAQPAAWARCACAWA